MAFQWCDGENPGNRGARSFIVSNMDNGKRHRVWAWLLCALLFWLTANPPHCDLCEGASFTVASSHQSILKHSIESLLIAVTGSALVAGSTASRVFGIFSSR